MIREILIPDWYIGAYHCCQKRHTNSTSKFLTIALNSIQLKFTVNLYLCWQKCYLTLKCLHQQSSDSAGTMNAEIR